MSLTEMSFDELKARKASLAIQIEVSDLMSAERSNLVYLLGLVGEEICGRGSDRMGQGRPIRLMARRSRCQMQEHPSTPGRGSHEGDVNMTGDTKKWRLVRMPEGLAQRLEVLAQAAEKAYSEGRRDLPAAVIDRVPLWFVVQDSLDHIEAKRARSKAPRAKKSQPVVTQAGPVWSRPDSTTKEEEPCTQL
jgi:hypothetical protein